MSDIFISYASEDRDRLLPVLKLLETKGWSVWWDRLIPIGRQFDEVIEEELSSARCMIVIWTESSVRSRWVRTEAAEGDRRDILVPIQFDSVALPLQFRRIQTAFLMNWNGEEAHPVAQRLLSSISELMEMRSSRLSKPTEVLEDHEISSDNPIIANQRAREVDAWIFVLFGMLIGASLYALGKSWVVERELKLGDPWFWLPLITATLLLLWRLPLRARRGMPAVRHFNAASLNYQGLLFQLSQWLSDQGFLVQAMRTLDGADLLMAKKKGTWRMLLGLSTALTIVLRYNNSDLAVEVGPGSWFDKLAVGTVSLFVLWPLAVTAAFGSWQQMRMPERTFSEVSRILTKMFSREVMPLRS
jgi:hypothetical protein